MDNKILLLTGASSDVAQELLVKIGHSYNKIIAIYNNSEEQIFKLQSMLGNTIVPKKVNLSSNESITTFLDEIVDERLIPNHVIHLAAVKTYNKKFEKDEIENFDKAFQVSVNAIAQILHVVLPYMKKSRYGKIVFMLSSGVLNSPPKYQAAYMTSKYALLGLMRCLAVEYADKGITINGISPDMMETKFLSNVPDLIVQKNAENNPLGRNIYISDVVPAFEYLLSDGANAVTGVNIPITGGKA